MPRRALQQHFGGLTVREHEVARLVAQGKSNRAIADELVVGVSTIEAHITHIFTKLGVSSRAQIAAWAVDKGFAQVPQDMGVPRQKHQVTVSLVCFPSTSFATEPQECYY